MSCKCVLCGECGGSGHVWVSFSGKYKGKNHSDDMDSMERCEDCGGSGLSEICDDCQAAYEAIMDDF